MTGKLSERAMLATLRTGVWSGNLADRAVTEEVSEMHQADSREAGRYSKQIVSRKFLNPVNSAARVARSTHRLLTLPWDDDGTRILSARGHDAYTEHMRKARIGFQQAVEMFLAGYPEYITEARKRLGTMFAEDDYPKPDELKAKFGFDVELRGVPDSSDFRVKLSDDTMKSVIKDIEKRTNARLNEALNDVFDRVAKVTEKMVEGLRAYEPTGGENGKSKNTFRDSLVYNINEVAELLPVLNITGDERIEKLHTDLKAQLVEHSPEILRANDKLRRQTADKAEKILAKVKKYMS